MLRVCFFIKSSETLNNSVYEKAIEQIQKGKLVAVVGGDHSSPFGLIKAGDMFAAWVAHDLLHTRQLIELRWAFTTQALEPYQVLYAGTW